MEKQGRTKSSIINMITAILGQGISMAISFIARIVFIQQLGEHYLGVNSLYTNIVGLLSLAELGVGTAINYSLYKPLAENDIVKIKGLMAIYRKLYYVIGLIILCLGIVLLPLLDLFMKSSETSSIPYRHLVFFLFVLNSAVSYFFSFKRALIISDQKRYIATIYRYLFFILMNIGQVAILLITKNFILFLLVALLSTIIENILISMKADSLYPYLKEKDISPIAKEDVYNIKKNTIALLYHKLGSSIVNSTDNILIAQLIGIASVGIYSNYQLIINAFNIVIAQFFMALTASIGNLGATEDSLKSQRVFYNIFFLNFCIAGLITGGIFATIDILIEIWFGKNFVVDKSVLLSIVINFYIYQIRRTVMTYRDAYGLFWQDRYKALVESILNIILSIYLGLKLGVTGIILGTILSTCFTSLWIEPYILFKYGFKTSSLSYFKKLVQYSVTTFLIGYSGHLLVNLLDLTGFLGFLLGILLLSLLTIVIIIILFFNTEEYQYTINLINRLIIFLITKLRSVKG